MKKSLCTLLLILLLLSLFPAAASAEGGAAVQAGDHIYIGEYTETYGIGESTTNPISWLVLDAEKTNSGEPGIFLLSQYVIQRSGVPFDDALADWQGSLAQEWCAAFLDKAFSDAERAVIPAVSKHEDELNYALYWRKVELIDERVFFLSAWEAMDYIGPEGSDGLTAYAVDGTGAYWWFRSGSFIHPDWTGLVLQGNDIHDSLVYTNWGARPAMNIDPAKVLLFVPAEGQPAIGESAAFTRPTDGNWKLVLTDETRQFALNSVSMEGDALKLSYSGAAVGEDEYLSLLVRDPEDRDLYRVRLCPVQQTAGDLTLNIDELGLPEGSRLYLFNEHEGGDRYSNTASSLCPIACQLRLEPGAGSGEAVTLDVTPGSLVSLEDLDFTAPAGQAFAGWEADGVPLDPDLPLEELRKIDAGVFYKPLPGSFMDPTAVRIPGSMVCDGDYIEVPDQTVSTRKYAADCDYLSGVNYGEVAMVKGFFLGGSGPMIAAEFYARARDLIGEKLYRQYDFENLVKVSDENAGPVSRWLASRGLTGGFNGFKSRYFGACRKSEGDRGRTYAYLFTRIPPTRPEDEEPGSMRGRDFLMAWHSADLWYTFASLRKGVPPVRPWEERDFSLAKQVCDYWANFMKTGDPNGEGLPVWPEADESMAWIELGDEITAHTEKDRLDQLIQAWLKENGDLPEEKG